MIGTARTPMTTIEQVASDLNQPVTIENVTDLERIMSYHVMSTPVAAIDGKVVHTCSVPKCEKITRWFES